MKLLLEYVQHLLATDSKLLIPPPPSIEYRLQELGSITYQYGNRHNHELLQGLLDKNAPGLFNLLLINTGKGSYKHQIQQLKEEIEPVIRFHKDSFNAPRPHELAKKHNIPFEYDDLASASSPSYPSGHTAQAFYIAEKLSKKFPDLTSDLFIIADMVSESRIDRGVHFPSDNEAGKLLAAKLAAKSYL